MNLDGPILLKLRFSNNTDRKITDLTFQMAVTKTYQMKMEPQSGRELEARQRDGITQLVRVAGAPRGAGGAVKMRWKASYTLGGEGREEGGVVEGLPVA